MTKMFSPDSGLVGILGNGEPIYIDKAIQKAYIDINELGTEAAAANGKHSIIRYYKTSSH